MFSKREKQLLELTAQGNLDKIREIFSYNYEQVMFNRIKKKVERMREELRWFDSLDIVLSHES